MDGKEPRELLFLGRGHSEGCHLLLLGRLLLADAVHLHLLLLPGLLVAAAAASNSCCCQCCSFADMPPPAIRWVGWAKVCLAGVALQHAKPTTLWLDFGSEPIIPVFGGIFVSLLRMVQVWHAPVSDTACPPCRVRFSSISQALPR